MIEGLKPYAEYKKSGSKWLGVVPATWEVRNLRTFISKRTERDRPDLPLLSVAREKGVFVRSLTEADENHNVIPDDLTNYKVARTGNLVINKMKAWQGSMGVAPCDGIVSPAYFVFDFRIANHAFGQWLLRSKPYVTHFAQASDGVRVGQWDLSIPGMRQIPVLVPAEDEQTTIVRFLDHANRKIGGFIRGKRKLISLLNEQKQAIIHQAVTRDLNPNAPLKPSGIPWLGDIPEHWETPLLGRFVRNIEQGWSPVAAEGELADQQWCVLTLSSIRRGVFNPAAIKPVATSEVIPREIEVVDGDFLLTRSNTRERVGDVCIGEGVRRRTLLCDLIYRLSLRTDALAPRFLMYQLLCQVGRSQIEKDARGSSGTMPKISQRHIKSWRVLLPPISEQLGIVTTIERASEPINTAIARTEREIALMQEYRTRLTADVATGKLDVRPTAAKPSDFPADSILESANAETGEQTDTELEEN